MITLHTLENSSRGRKPRKRVGRGIGSKTGKTCGRGEKGAGARAGSKRRYGKEGGQMPLFMKTPIRGFSNVAFRQAYDAINLKQLNEYFDDGELVNMESLLACGLIGRRSHGVKILGNGNLTKKLKIQAHAISSGAREKLAQAHIHFEIVNP